MKSLSAQDIFEFCRNIIKYMRTSDTKFRLLIKAFSEYLRETEFDQPSQIHSLREAQSMELRNNERKGAIHYNQEELQACATLNDEVTKYSSFSVAELSSSIGWSQVCQVFELWLKIYLCLIEISPFASQSDWRIKIRRF